MNWLNSLRDGSMIDDGSYIDDCYALSEGTCPVMLEEQDKPCDGCRWLTLNPDYVPKEVEPRPGDL